MAEALDQTKGVGQDRKWVIGRGMKSSHGREPKTGQSRDEMPNVRLGPERVETLGGFEVSYRGEPVL